MQTVPPLDVCFTSLLHPPTFRAARAWGSLTAPCTTPRLLPTGQAHHWLRCWTVAGSLRACLPAGVGAPLSLVRICGCFLSHGECASIVAFMRFIVFQLVCACVRGIFSATLSSAPPLFRRYCVCRLTWGLLFYSTDMQERDSIIIVLNPRFVLPAEKGLGKALAILMWT